MKIYYKAELESGYGDYRDWFLTEEDNPTVKVDLFVVFDDHSKKFIETIKVPTEIPNLKIKLETNDYKRKLKALVIRNDIIGLKASLIESGTGDYHINKGDKVSISLDLELDWKTLITEREILESFVQRTWKEKEDGE